MKVCQTDLIQAAIAGKVVSFPTDTVPALAVLPEKSAQIFTLKQRSPSKPLILMGASWGDLSVYIKGTAAELQIWQKMTETYWPGALTLVLPAVTTLTSAINPQDNTIGLRVPDFSIAQAILSQTGPLATTSANLSGFPPLETLSDIDCAFPEVFVLDCGEKENIVKLGSSLPSTVAKWTGKKWQVLRQGSVRI